MPSPKAVYARLMAQVDKTRGYPLWLPGLSTTLPEDYHRTGLKIGDVGLVTQHGDFDVLFNICLPENHPIHHPDGVPSNFRQVILNRQDVHEFPFADTKGLVLATQSVSHRTVPRSVSGHPNATTSIDTRLSYEFNSSSPEGAILALPEGAAKADLADNLASEFRQLALQNAAAWYHFAYFHLGRTSISNDSLYLITGYHKSSSWFLASFSQPETNTACSLSITASPVVNGNAAAAYSWVGRVTGSFGFRSGPHHRYSQENPNQTLFSPAQDADAEPVDITQTQTGMVPSPLGTPSDVTMDIDNSCSGVSLQRTPGVWSKVYHPADAMNQVLLDRFPSADVAVTHDSQWCDMLPSESTNPHLVEHISTEFVPVCDPNGFAYFSSKSAQSILCSRSVRSQTGQSSAGFGVGVSAIQCK
ncbi:hypothetical protein BU15DRAFT_83408 [Melanogaster broomeanus]|nr:hypothetical protein BU15DRAFT_83408 [Melanogaster broomeanus]